MNVEVGQIWDDVFGPWTWRVVYISDYHAVLRNTRTPSDEKLVPLTTFKPHLTGKVPGNGWRLLDA